MYYETIYFNLLNYYRTLYDICYMCYMCIMYFPRFFKVFENAFFYYIYIILEHISHQTHQTHQMDAKTLKNTRKHSKMLKYVFLVSIPCVLRPSIMFLGVYVHCFTRYYTTQHQTNIYDVWPGVWCVVCGDHVAWCVVCGVYDHTTCVVCMITLHVWCV